MKNSILYFLGVIVFSFFSVPLFANINCSKEQFYPCEAVYVLADQIEFHQNNIFVKINNKTIQTSAIYTADRGMYFTNFRHINSKKQGDCKSGYWECPNCFHCNPNYNIWCENCWE